jgi:hypothetical protein
MRPSDLRRRHRLFQISTWLSSLLATYRSFAAPSSGCLPNDRSATGLVLVRRLACQGRAVFGLKKSPERGTERGREWGCPWRSWSLVHPCPDGSGLRRENVPTIENRNEPAARCATGPPALIASARPCADKCWHQLLPGLVNRLREKPLEISHGARLLSRPFRQISLESVAAIPRTVPLLAEPSVSMGNEANATIAIWI